jgi:hypothetical protein
MPSHRHVDLKVGAVDRRRRMARARRAQGVRHATLPLRNLLKPRSS